MTKIQNSNLDEILKGLNSRHFSESRGEPVEPRLSP
jgi:hypothetical protein